MNKNTTRHNFQRKSIGVPMKQSEAASPFSIGLSTNKAEN